jgi:hypothetical protein
MRSVAPIRVRGRIGRALPAPAREAGRKPEVSRSMPSRAHALGTRGGGRARLRRGRAAMGLPLLLALAWSAGGPIPVFAADAESKESASAEPVFPQTIERVWYRSEETRKRGGGRRTGDLTISGDGLTFSARRGETRLSLDSIHRISYGKMRGDVNTDWVVLVVTDGESRHLVGIRDGRKFGYGTRTRQIYETLLAAVRRYGAAQYRVPDGFETYDELDHQFTIAIPEGWSSYHRSLVEVDGRAMWGEVLFMPGSAPKPSTIRLEGKGYVLQRSLNAVLSGENGGFFVDRREAQSGMSCEGFTEKARNRLLMDATEDPLFPEDGGKEESTRTEPIVVDGCHGLRILRRSRQPGEPERVLDRVAVCRGETLYFFGLRSRADRYEADRKVYETSLASVRFSVAR